jgi:hypothetical protein
MILMALVWGRIIATRLNPENLQKVTTARQHMQYLEYLQKFHKEKFGF